MLTNFKDTRIPLFFRMIRFGNRFVDYRMAIAGAMVLGVIVFCINYFGSGELKGAVTAALKQGAYTFLFGGVIMRGCENLSTRIHKRWIALASAIIVPSVLAIGLTFGVHSMKGTPKPVESTVPTAILVIPSTAVWSLRKRKKQSLKHLNDQAED
jgi:hypothetical protein